MNRIHIIERDVRALYAAKNSERTDWADWLGEHHIFWVADKATQLARRFGANEELSRVAALMHDIADTRMSRFADEHEEASLSIARRFMHEANFSETEIALVVDDALRFHRCRDGSFPASIEGKVFATADSLAHLQTDFYVFATWSLGKEKTLSEVKDWVLNKIDRDFNEKLLFDEVKRECKEDYERLKLLFTR